MASPSRTGAASPAVRWGEKDLTSFLSSCHRARETLLWCQAGSPWQSSAGSVRAPPLSPHFLPSPRRTIALLRQMGAQPQHPCPAASSPASSSSPPSPRCPGGSAHRPPLSGTARSLRAAFPSSFSTSRLQLPPPSADRGARSRTAPFSPQGEEKPGSASPPRVSASRAPAAPGRRTERETPPNAKEEDAGSPVLQRGTDLSKV